MQYEIQSIGISSLFVRFPATQPEVLLPVLSAVTQKLQTAPDIGPAILDVIPCYDSILVNFHLLKIERQVLTNAIAQIITAVIENSHEQVNSPEQVLSQSEKIVIPVCYHESLAPDLADLAKYNDLSVEEVIKIHSDTLYRCYAIGFMPGFAYLADVDPRIRMPRHASPRAEVAKGSVGIADNQTAVYPKASPGGWQIIGRCPIELLLPVSEGVSKFTVGCQVKFEPISLAEFKLLQNTNALIPGI